MHLRSNQHYPFWSTMEGKLLCIIALWPFSLDQMENFNLWDKSFCISLPWWMAYDNFNVLSWNVYVLSEMLAVTVWDVSFCSVYVVDK